MRIALLNWTARRVGGVEQYLHRLLPALTAAGHATALFAETDGPADRSPITDRHLPADPSTLRSWQPDVLINHGLLAPAREAALLAEGPAVLLAHAYYGTCISGAKTFTFPTATPCTRTLGWGCLLRYYPRRTGGLDPRTLARAWDRQRARQAHLTRYRAVAVFSEHMRTEYLRHGTDPDRTTVLPFPVAAPATRARAAPAGAARLLFVGRCDPLKGGAVLIDALRHLPTGTTLMVVGDGPARLAWQRRATRRRAPVRFTGWRNDVDAAYRDADLLVVPSLWPEPFGQVGLEAARFGLPAVAFPVGGIGAWLRDGTTGLLAARPAHAGALATAIRRALEPATYATLSAGAVRGLHRHTMEAHLTALLGLLARAR